MASDPDLMLRIAEAHQAIEDNDAADLTPTATRAAAPATGRGGALNSPASGGCS
ncbi:hypothetical protein ACI1MP_37600 (plasmid) [Kitasatospora griseola]|uniref:hypothetical protein n=1 Tax=Kitasatospora griseola TaxID=2064 RepID=UPI003855B0EF